MEKTEPVAVEVKRSWVPSSKQEHVNMYVPKTTAKQEQQRLAAIKEREEKNKPAVVPPPAPYQPTVHKTPARVIISDGVKKD